jgi:oxygen-independent coproporphyrinogen-3 oxidase
LVDSEGLFVLTDVVDTLFVGGGTPSLLGPEAMAGLKSLLGARRLASPELEWTAEANPESLTEEVAVAWRSAGVNRLSLGAQSFHPDALRWMGRLHGPDGAGRAVAAARGAGIDNLSVDLMFGLPAQVERDWRKDLEEVLSLEVPHVSLYGLTVEQATPLGRAVREGRETPVDEERYREEYLLAAEILGSEGYEHYEVSNFARPGMQSRHNLTYWLGDPYLGLGNGAHSYAPPVRRWNGRSWEDYAARVREGNSPEEGRETLDAQAVALEGAWLGLRTSRGIPMARMGANELALVAEWVRQGLAEEKDGSARLTPTGWLVLDRLAVELDAASSA